METKENYLEKHRKKQRKRILLVRTEIGLMLFLFIPLALWVFSHPPQDKNAQMAVSKNAVIVDGSKTDTNPANKNHVPCPAIDKQHLTVNEYSRPGIKNESVDKIVVHYMGNPQTTAQENHDYFESLKDLQNDSMSSNFIIGLQGEIIECVPPGEVAYASNSMNRFSISIENCHPDTTGKFTEATYQSCVSLVAYLLEQYDLDRDDIIRHYDVTGKECPLYFVTNEDEWEKFKDNVMTYIANCSKS